MQLKTITSAKDLPFAGIEFVKTDKVITEVIIGGKVRIKQDGTYSNNLKVMIEAPYEEATRHRVTAKIDGFDPKVQHFEASFDATRAQQEFENKGAEVTVEQVTVFVDDAGEVVPGAAAEQATASADLEIPF